MRRIFFLICCWLPTQLLSQSYINKTPKQVKQNLGKMAKSAGHRLVSETDSTLTFIISNRTDSVTYSLGFDENKKCFSERIITGCDACFTKQLNSVLKSKEYNWKKINENQYVSDFASYLMIEIPPENTEYSFTILRMTWSRELYDLLMENKEPEKPFN